MGNITQTVQLPYTTTATSSPNTANGTAVGYTYNTGSSSWNDLLVNYNGTSITYDNVGNPLNWRNATEFVWSARELSSAILTDGNTVSYIYNADGIRTQKVYNGTTHNYILDGSKIIKEAVSVNGTTSYELYYIYDNTGSVIGFHYNNMPYYFLKNLQGDVVSIINSAGVKVVEYTYDAWGKLLTTTGTLASTIGTYNPFRYRGYYYDTETGWYYLQSRYYDPTVGRFINADGYVSTGQGLLGFNMFAYCGNNPVIYKDESGRFFKLAAIAVAIVVCLVVFTSSEAQPEPIKTPDTEAVDKFLEKRTILVNDEKDHNNTVILPKDTENLMAKEENREYASKIIKDDLGPETKRTEEDIADEIFAHYFIADKVEFLSLFSGKVPPEYDIYQRISTADIDENEKRIEFYNIVEWVFG